MKKIFIAPICLMIIFTFSSIASSKIALLSLSDMIQKSEMIAIGEVVKVEKTNEKLGVFLLSKVIITIETVLKGNQNTKSVDIYFVPNLEDEPDFSLDDKGIFFIHKYLNRYMLVQGIAGKIDIKNDGVKNINILEQANNQPVDSFVHKIEDALEKIKTKLTKDEVVKIAQTQVKQEGFNLTKYILKGCYYEFTEKDKTWTVNFERKPPTPPGGHFSVYVDDQTKKATLMHGE